MWVAVGLMALSSQSYNAAATMALIRSVPPGAAGRASGVMFVGFHGGIATGPLLFGWMIDSTGSYPTVWRIAAGLFIVGAAIARFGMAPEPAAIR